MAQNRRAKTAAAEPLPDSPTRPWLLAPPPLFATAAMCRHVHACIHGATPTASDAPSITHVIAVLTSCGVELICIPNHDQVVGTKGTWVIRIPERHMDQKGTQGDRVGVHTTCTLCTPKPSRCPDAAVVVPVPCGPSWAPSGARVVVLSLVYLTTEEYVGMGCTRARVARVTWKAGTIYLATYADVAPCVVGKKTSHCRAHCFGIYT